MLLVSTDLDDVDDLKDAARSHGAVIVDIGAWSALGVEFCKAFQVGACLRWPLGMEQFDSDEKDTLATNSADDSRSSDCEVPDDGYLVSVSEAHDEVVDAKSEESES